MNEQSSTFTHVSEEERNLPTSQLLDRLRDAMTAKGRYGQTIKQEGERLEKQQVWDKGAEEREIQVLENFAKQYFDFLGKLIGKKSYRAYTYTDLKTGEDEVLNIYREAGGFRAIFKYGGRHIDLTFFKERDDRLAIKQHLGGDKGTRRHPVDATPYKNDYDFAGPNLKYMREELSALSAVIDAVDDFRADIS